MKAATSVFIRALADSARFGRTPQRPGSYRQDGERMTDDEYAPLSFIYRHAASLLVMN